LIKKNEKELQGIDEQKASHQPNVIFSAK